MGQVKGNNSNRIDNKSATKCIMVDVDERPAEGILSWGAFSDSTTQSASLAYTPYSMKLSHTEGANGFTIENDSNGFPTRIKALKTGVYNLQFSAQLSNTANTNISYHIWLAYTGSMVKRSNTEVSLTKVSGQNGRQVASWNFVQPIQQLDYVELKWSCDSTTGQILASGSFDNGDGWIFPTIPSVIATVTQVG
jgi:hypothetical protein